jgi:hypothetical protein
MGGEVNLIKVQYMHVWNTMAKPPWTINMNLGGLVWGCVLPRMGRINTEGREGWIWLMYFIYVHENRTIKPVQIVLRKGKEERKENNEGVESNQSTVQTCMEMS